MSFHITYVTESHPFSVDDKESVTIPSWLEFCALEQRFKESEENKQALWDAINQFKRSQNADIYSEFRALRDAAFAAYRQLNGPLPDGEWTAWKCIGVAGKRLDALDQRLNALPESMREAVREAVRAELTTLVNSVITNLDSILKDNGELKSKTDSLSDEVEHWRVRVESAEKQFQAVPDKVAELQRLIDDAKVNLNCARDENRHLKEEVTALRKELETCRKDVDVLLHPPKRKWFSEIRTRCSGFFRKIFSRGK